MKPNLNLVLASFERAHHLQSPAVKRDDRCSSLTR